MHSTEELTFHSRRFALGSEPNILRCSIAEGAAISHSPRFLLSWSGGWHWLCPRIERPARDMKESTCHKKKTQSLEGQTAAVIPLLQTESEKHTCFGIIPVEQKSLHCRASCNTPQHSHEYKIIPLEHSSVSKPSFTYVTPPPQLAKAKLHPDIALGDLQQ